MCHSYCPPVIALARSEAWEPFKAANAALANIVEKDVVADLNEKFSTKVPKLLAQLKQLLTEGVLTEQVCEWVFVFGWLGGFVVG